MSSYRLAELSLPEGSTPVRVAATDDRWFDIAVPSVGEYPVYDDMLYQIMIADTPRTDGYRRAVRRHARGKTVLDIGTGQDALWAIASAEAGARKVYGVETIPESARLARDAVDRAGYSDRVTIVEGLSTDVELPEPIDLCVSEIIGTLGGSEGAASVLSAARRDFMAPGGAFIPQWSATTVGAVDLSVPVPDLQMCLDGDTAKYLEKIFEHVGRPFDVRMCLPGLRIEDLISTRATVEELTFADEIPMDGKDQRELVITRDRTLHGFMIGMLLRIDDVEPLIDSTAQASSWIPVYAPVSDEGIPVREGDRIVFDFSWSLSDDGVHPDYRMEGEIRRAGQSAVAFEWDSPHHGTVFRGNGFYRSLFPVEGP
ncbi:SAM-dependent methyltransferase [Amycolatopsis antarctica]|uniref:SAM-dependent methyltransferase n=1 Tax=Amycolatopsis antarctica TaxID=1854586 RepID=A0A263D5N7_9PSEU|nr:50S ribosomal protein L11 methyltransferase [Amycolatopsis antarctica]OZM72907.1 SAM-dependent methyltransferase [Amycolatopsis antarctica]